MAIPYHLNFQPPPPEPGNNRNKYICWLVLVGIAILGIILIIVYKDDIFPKRRVPKGPDPRCGDFREWRESPFECCTDDFRVNMSDLCKSTSDCERRREERFIRKCRVCPGKVCLNTPIREWISF